MEVSKPISQPDQSPAAAAANPVSPSMSMDTRALDKARKRQLAEAKGYISLINKPASSQPLRNGSLFRLLTLSQF